MIITYKCKPGFFILTGLVIAFMVLNSCRNDYSLSPQEYARIYIPQARDYPAEYNVVTGIDSLQTFNFQVVYGGPGSPKQDINVRFSVMPALVDSFNIKNFTAYTLLPEGNYKVSDLSTVIPVGDKASAELTLTIDGSQPIPEGKYLLPITIAETNADVPLSDDLRTLYFVFNAHLIKPAHSKIIITGFLVNPDGSDCPEIGDGRSYDDTKVSFTFQGGLEYVQCMALEDIDFSETPYSLVVGRYNSGPMTDGWATGGSVSFKFNLTEGTAAAGTFFYVGEGQMVIDGYSHQGFSTDISNANWIRNISPNVGDDNQVVGDGFGNSTSGLFTNGEDNATGFAVFEGTNITGSSIPDDVVFYGGSVGNAYQPPYGYQIPVISDLYGTKDEDTGDDQALFGQGTNTFSVSGANSSGVFVQMGGIFSKGHVFEPRTHPNLLELTQTSTLSDIEGGEATQYIK